MPISEASALIDVVSRRLAVVRGLRERLRDEDDDELPRIQQAIGLNLWLLGPDFDALPFKPDVRIAAKGSRFFESLSPAQMPQRSVGFYALKTSNPFHANHCISQLVILLLPRFEARPGHEERSMIWQCTKHLRLGGRIAEDTRVTGFILSDLFDHYEHERSQCGEFTVIQPRHLHSMLDAAERRLVNMY